MVYVTQPSKHEINAAIKIAAHQRIQEILRGSDIVTLDITDIPSSTLFPGTIKLSNLDGKLFATGPKEDIAAMISQVFITNDYYK